MAHDAHAAPITVAEAAAALDGGEYGNEGNPALFARMKAAGLVAIFGYSDDLMEIRGAVDDEVGFDAWFTPAGLLENNCENDRCPHFLKMKAEAAHVEALFGEEAPYSFTYKTAIPHETFTIVEDGDPYCRGIVFALAELKPAASASA